MKKRVECIVSGRVQLVGFRYFVSNKAKKLGILGAVENLKDGTVRVFGEGEEDKLSEFMSCLRKGPIFSRVENVSVVFGDPKNEFNDFHIIY